MSRQQEDTQLHAGRFRLRPVTPADNAALAAVLRAVMAEFGAAGEGSSALDPEVDDIAGAYGPPGCAYFVVDEGGLVVGGGGLGPLAGGDPGTCELRKMYLLARGRGHGAGRAVLTRCLETARALGYERMYLETMTTMTGARRLYERNGFTPVAKPLGHTGHFGCDAWYVRAL
jgi:putative acetyltransferase